MYGTSADTAAANREAIAVQPIAERNGQQLRNILLDRGFGDTPVAGGLTLLVAPLAISETDLGLAPDNTATRRLFSISSGIILKRGNEVLLNRGISATSTYTVLISQYGTLVSRQDAEKQTLTDLARQIEMHTTLYLKDSGATP